MTRVAHEVSTFLRLARRVIRRLRRVESGFARVHAPEAWIFGACLAVLLAGYMFLGRGFAHLGASPVYVGEVVLAIGVICVVIAWARHRVHVTLVALVPLLVGFMLLGAARTIPYLSTYGFDALRDAVLWGYAILALLIYAFADRGWISGTVRLYGFVLPVFAIWLPISLTIFMTLGAGIDPNRLGSDVPLVFFKSGDMAVHIVGCIAFLILVAPITTWRGVLWRSLVLLPILWTAVAAGATNRGGLVAAIAGIATILALSQRLRQWVPVLAATSLLALAGLTSVAVDSSAGQRVTSRETAEATVPSEAPQRSAEVEPSESESDTEPDAPVATLTSLVVNPGFELGEPNNALIEGWNLWAGTYNIVGGGGYRGAKYASVQNTGEPYTAAVTSNRFPFEAGEDISVSARAKAISGEPVVEIYVNWFDRRGEQISSTHLATLATEGVATWQEADGALTAPAGTTEAQVVIYEASGDGATLGLDEVVVRAGEFLTRSLVNNPSFELGEPNNALIEGWNLWAGSYNILIGDGYSGAKYASVQNTGEPYTAAVTSNRFPFEAGQDISVSVHAKAISGAPVLEIYATWFDRRGEQISSTHLSTLTTDGLATWQEAVGVLTAPVGTTEAQIILYEASGDGATLGLDEVVVKAGDFITPPGVAPPAPDAGRQATIAQLLENITSIFSESSDENLEGTKAFRLRWWAAIVDYTLFGENFWTGKGFGVNLADDDGFQANLDRSLRAPHNSHMTVLARMGVPGFVLWAALQAAFGIGLLRSVLVNRRAGDTTLAAIGAWILAYWVAMMVNTSFDPYLEGPQGGIWFWSLFGLGMVVMRFSHRPRKA